MSNVLKKAFSVGVVATNILWSVGIAAFVPSAVQAATCPSFSSGDLVKAEGYSAIYAIDSNGKTLYFPTGDEFKSWNTDEKYAGYYTTVSVDCFNSTLLTQTPKVAPLAVGFRPGSYVLKSPSSDQLFVVEPGNKLAKITADAAKALYGAYKPMQLSVVQYSNYDVTSAPQITEAIVHPGMLVSNGGKNWYVDADSKLRQVTDAGMAANRFKKLFVHAVSSSALSGLSTGAMIDGLVPSVADRTQTGGTSAPVNPGTTSGNVSVSLAADTPAGLPVAQKATGVVFTKFNVTASSGAVTVNDVTLHRTGLGQANDLAAVYLYDGNTRLTSGRTVSSDTNNVIFSNVKLSLNAGQTKTLTVVADIDPSNAVSGDASGFEVTSVNGTAVTGVAGNIMTVGATAASTVSVDNVGGTGGSVTLGSSQAEVASFKVDASNATNNVSLSAITLTNDGSLANSNLSNLNLLVSGNSTPVASTASLTADGKAIFVLSSPIVISKGDSKTFYVYADNTGGRTSDTIEFFVDETTDVRVMDTQLNTGAYVTNSFATGEQIYTLTGGNITLASNGPATGNIARNQTNVVLQKFSFSAANPVTVKTTNVEIDLYNSSGVLASSSTVANYVKNVKIVDLDNNNQTVVGPLANFGTGTTNGSTGVYTKEFNDNFDVNAGQTRHFAVMADIDTNFPSAWSLLSKVDYSGTHYVKYQSGSEYVSSSTIVPSTLAGNKQTVVTASLTMTRVTPPASLSAVKGSTVQALGLLMTPSTSNDVKINSLKVRVMASTTAFTSGDAVTGDTGANQVVNTVAIAEDGGATLMTKNLTDSTGTVSAGGSNYYYVTFNNLNYVLKAGAPKKLIVSLGLKDTLPASTVYVKADVYNATSDVSLETSPDAKSASLNGSAVLVNSTSPVVVTVSTGGSISATIDGSTPTSDIVLSGSNSTLGGGPVTTAVYSFKSTKESSTITGAAVTLSDTSKANDIKDVTLTYVDHTGATVTKTAFLNGNGVAIFNDGTLDIRLIRDQNTLVTVGADLNTNNDGAISGDSFKLGFKTSGTVGSTTSGTFSNDFVVLGDSGTKKYGVTDSIGITDNGLLGTFTIYKTKVTAAQSDTASASHSTRAQDPVGVFTFTSAAEPQSSQNSTLVSASFRLTGSLIAGNGTGDDSVSVSVYSGSSFDAAHLMGSNTIGTVASGTSATTTISFTAQNQFSGTRQIYLVVDTTDSDFSDTSNNVEKLTTALTGFAWNDGTTLNNVATASNTTGTPVTGLPVYGLTYSY